ncbi:unnamed protein product [Polarella glacialis]|uniref:Uncharacterized protein n=1 Tax=Polarella glacialis TaxID=89957 RepID=A0A813LCK0_POLGL|nr:unnamed protein product [Polarella glacialis]
MPPKGVDGTDVAVVAARKVELEKVLRAMLSSPEVLMEKELSIWKFLDLGNPAVIVGRFIMVPRARANALKTMSKLNDVKYKDDVYRLGHQVVTDLLMEGLREQRRGNSESHWATQAQGLPKTPSDSKDNYKQRTTANKILSKPAAKQT